MTVIILYFLLLMMVNISLTSSYLFTRNSVVLKKLVNNKIIDGVNHRTFRFHERKEDNQDGMNDFAEVPSKWFSEKQEADKYFAFREVKIAN